MVNAVAVSHASRYHASRDQHHAMERRVEPELLDDLPPDDPRAVRSRKDLLRVNAWMGNCGIMARALRATCQGPAARRLVELGAGDGRFLWRVARRLQPGWRGTSAVLLDRWNIVSPETCQALAALDWGAEPVEADVLDWLRQAVRSRLRRDDCEFVPASLPRGPTGGPAVRGGGAGPGVHRHRTPPLGAQSSSSAACLGSSAATG